MKIGTQFILTTLSKTGHQISVFVLSIILARYFTKADYGTYLHVQLIANVAIWACLLGIPHSVYYFLPRTHEKRRFILTSLTIILAIACVVATAIFFGSGAIASFLGNPNINYLALILAGLVLFQIPITIFEPLMISAQRVKSYVIWDIVFNCSFFLAIVVPVSLGLPLHSILTSLMGVYAAQSLVILVLAISLALSHRRESKVPTLAPYSLQEQFKYAIPIGFSMGAVELSRYADKVIVSNQTSPEDFAVYSRGATNIPIISIIANTLDNLIMPKFVEAYRDGDVDELLRVWHSMIRLMAALIYPCCAFLIISAPLLIPALFSDKFIGSVAIFQIYTLALLTRISTYNVIVRALGKTTAMLWVVLMGMACNIMLTFLFINVFGLIGAPMATGITTLLISLAYLKVITHYLKISLNAVFPWQSLVRSIATSLVSALPLFFLIDLDFNVWIRLGLMATVYGSLYLILLRSVGGLTGADRYALREMLPHRLRWVFKEL